MENVKWLVETSMFGTIVGFFLGKLGSRIDDDRRDKKHNNQLLRNLYHEVGQNRFRAQAILQGEDPIYFETHSWDAVRLSKALSILDEDKPIFNKIYFLYHSISLSNLRVGATLTAIESIIRNPANSQTGEMSNSASRILREYIQVSLLPKLIEMETALRLFLSGKKIEV